MTPINVSPLGRRVRGSSKLAAAKLSSKGWQFAAAMAETVADDSEDSKQKQRRRFSVGEQRIVPGETLDWVPAGWIVEDRVRSSGSTAGMIDKVRLVAFYDRHGNVELSLISVVNIC